MVKVSVILPSLNVADYIEECIESVTRQTLQEIEMICVDAGSEDGTYEKLEHYAEHDDRIKLLCSDKRSYGYQVNKGLDIASGEYIAILETDDYVDCNMYEKLYRTAKENALDFVLADYDEIWDENGRRCSNSIITWAEYPQIYGKVLDSDDFKRRYNANPNLWRGIYSKHFLQKNQIRLNETKGAAYQDISFMHRVIMHAQRAMFVPESYYRYRVDRAGSSVNSVNGLRYAYQEYQYLLETNSIVSGFEERVYYVMVHSFMAEIRQIRPRMTENWVRDNQTYYEWFRKQIIYGFEHNYINQSKIGSGAWSLLGALMKSVKDYFHKLDSPGNLESIQAKIKGAPIVIFGAGARGKGIMSKLKSKAKITAFCDNSEILWHSEINGVPVIPLDECRRQYSDCYYIVCVKGHYDEIHSQLYTHGVAENRILRYVADGEE